MDTVARTVHRDGVKGWLWAVIILIFINTAGADGTNRYLLSTHPVSNYTLFNGPIEVSYTIPFNVTSPEGIIQVVSLKDDSVITQIKIPPGFYTGVLTIMCGTLDYAGDYVFHLREGEDKPVLVESSVMRALWPRASVTLPSSHTALTSEVTMHVNVDKTQCESAHGTSKYVVEVVYYGTNETYFGNQPEPKQYIYRDIVNRLAYLQNVPKVLSCDLLDQGGVYRGRIQSVHAEDNSVAMSDIMYVKWSPEYSLVAPKRSIFPCERNFEVQYSQPQCSGHNDKIRMYGQKKTNSSLASPIILDYRSETRARKSSTRALFSCDKFHEDAYGYCFKYMSFARNGAINEQKAICVPTTDVPVIDGVWGSWSDWSSCTASCGLGKQNRYRACDSPPPSQGGMFCQGSHVEYKDCETVCVASSTPAPLYTPDPSCRCGCEFLRTEGRIVSSYLCRGSSMWTIRAKKGHKIKLSFLIFNLNWKHKETYIKIRNGDSLTSELLVHSFGGPKPRDIITNKRAMLIEFFTPYTRDLTTFSRNEGFVANYRTYVDNNTMIVPPGPASKQSIWGSTVTIVGITLCAVIIIACVAIVCHNRRMRKQKKLRKAQAHQALLGNGEVPGSPAHSAHSLQGSANISYTDMVGGAPSKREYVKAKGVSAARTPGSPSEVALRMQKKKQTVPSPGRGGREVAQNSRRSSRSSSHRKGSAGTPGSFHQSPIPSPYALNANQGDYCHDPDMFRVSPIPPEESQSKSRQHKRRSPHSPPVSPTRVKGTSHGSRSPTKSMGSMRSMSPGSRTDSRNQSFHEAIGNKMKAPGAPLADLEDISPTTHSSPTHKLYGDKNKGKMAPIKENIPMDSHSKKRSQNVEESPLEKRPPVEGRDSLTRKGMFQDPKAEQKQASMGKPGQGKADIEMRPYVKPLPLRDVQRPDGQSPENKPVDPNTHTPSSHISDVSPLFQKSQLFPEQGSRTPSEVVFMEQDFEYDDYMPDLPGSYFTMDPHAYTLTWSQQAPWAQQKGVSQAGSLASVRTADMGLNNSDKHP